MAPFTHEQLYMHTSTHTHQYGPSEDISHAENLVNSAFLHFLFPTPQISKHGGPVEITNEEQIVTVGISFTSPVLLIPDVLLVARPIYQSEEPTLLQDTRFSPRRKVKYELSR